VPDGVRLHADVEDAAGRLGDPARATGAWRPVRGRRRGRFERVDDANRLVDRLEDRSALSMTRASGPTMYEPRPRIRECIAVECGTCPSSKA
jgi:hypothetical protein